MDTAISISSSGVDAQGNVASPSQDNQKEMVQTVDTPVVEDSDTPKTKSKKVRIPSPPLSDSDKIEDPVALKLESALKRSIADRTGNLALKEEAAREQSRADKLGARAGLTKQQHERAKKEAEQLRSEAAIKQSLADRTGDVALKKEAAAQQHLADKLIANANKALLAHEKAEAAAREQSGEPAITVSSPPTDPAPQQPSSTIINLKSEASTKQSEADKSGDEKLKRAAAKEQSRADKARALALKLQQDGAEGKEPLSLLRNASAIDVSLTKPKGTPLSRMKSANNVSLPKMPFSGLQEPATTPATVSPLPLTRQKSACDASLRNKGDKEKGMMRAKSGDSIVLKSYFSTPSNSKWSSPSTTQVKFAEAPNPNSPKWPQSRFGVAKKEEEPKKKVSSPARSDAPSWRLPTPALLPTPTSTPTLVSSSTSTTMDKVIVPTVAKKVKVDAATNTDFDPELLAEGEPKC